MKEMVWEGLEYCGKVMGESSRVDGDDNRCGWMKGHVNRGCINDIRILKHFAPSPLLFSKGSG